MAVLNALQGWELIVFFAIIIVFLVMAIVVTVILLGRLRWPYKVLVLEETPLYGNSPVRRDKARLISVGDGGEEVYYLKKAKKYRVAYGKKIAPKYVAWSIGSDGYWYNITFGNVDKKLMEIGVQPINTDVRYATSSLRKMFNEAYKKKSFLEKYGPIVYFGMFIFVLLIFAGLIWYSTDKQIEIASANADAIATAKEIMDTSVKLLEANSRISQGGSGITPA